MIATHSVTRKSDNSFAIAIAIAIVIFASVVRYDFIGRSVAFMEVGRPVVGQSDR